MQEGRYEYQEKIGEGGMATVYKGRQVSLDRPVAIKVLSATLSDNPSVLKRFKRESLIIARLNHPNIIHVIDRGTTSKGRPVFVMEFVEGTNLADAISERKYDFNEKVDIAIQICKGVGYAHKFDVIHRDIKPANVIIDTEGFARLLDFGIASFFESDKDMAPDETRLIMGTEAYMAPEQHKGIAYTSNLSDIYSLGIVMYELFTGTHPAPNAPSMSEFDPSITPELENLINQCLALDPNERPQSVDQVRTKLLLAMKGQHIDKEKVHRAGEGLASIQEKFGLLDVMQEDKFGAVYLYEDKSSHKLLVIKKKNSTFTGFREAKMLHNLKHPNLVNILGTSKNNSMFIVVMEYVSGGSLQDRLIEPMGMQMFLGLAVQMCRGMSFAHQNRICHGNLRPSNILLTSDYQVKITDFGLDEHYRMRDRDGNWYGDSDDRKDELSDVFSLGAIFYHALTGVPPTFKDGKLVKTQIFVKLPVDIQQLIMRMLSRRREQRPQSIESILSELLPLQEEEKTKVIEVPQEEAPALVQKETIIKYKYQRVNWLTILFAVVMVVSLALNVLLLGDHGEDIRSAVVDFLWNYL